MKTHVERDSQTIIGCTGYSLLKIGVSASPVHCWLYFLDREDTDFRDLIKHVAYLPSTHIAVSGPACAEIHDQIDDLLVEFGDLQITTTWNEEPDGEAAWDFVHLDFNPNAAACRLVAVIGGSLADQLSKLSGLLNLCADAARDE
jgi:hypothetical protein